VIYCETWFCRAEPIVIADAHAINIFEEFCRFLLDQLVEPFGAIFLHAFKAHEQIDWEFNSGMFVRLNDVKPAQNRALVVR